MNRRSFLQVSSTALLAGSVPGRLFAAALPGTPDFSTRAFEYSGMGLWQWKSIDRALAMMEELGFNTLILHQSDLPDYLVRPRSCFSDDFMAARNPTRWAVTHTGRNYIREVVRRAARAKLRVFLSSNEIGFADGLVELHPELLEEGSVVCPTHPFWWEFERAKFAEVISEIPGLGGFVVSPASRDGKLSFAVRNCDCARCRSYDPAAWYANLVRSIHEPVAAAGQTLVVRDYAYTREEQNHVVYACSRVSPDIVVSMKNTPHDYYPAFPDNPRIGDAGGQPQWVEFDAMGKFAGSGVFPCSLVEDMRRRLGHARRNGVTGVSFRADIETVTDSSVFNSPNILNLFAGGLLSRSASADLGGIYSAWFAYGLSDPLKTDSEQPGTAPVGPGDAGRIREFMQSSRAVLEKTLYVRGLVIADGTGQFPDSVDRAFDNMLVLHQREDWEPGASRRVEPTEENLRLVAAEKEQAEREAARLPVLLDLGKSRLPGELRASLETMLDLYQGYVRGFRRCTLACFTTRRAMVTRAPEDVAAARSAAGLLADYRTEMEGRLSKGFLPHYVHRILDLGCIERLMGDVQSKLASISAGGGPGGDTA
ncbi:MAG: hypothetical protein ABSA05_00550 [Opitutaceae bacterium]|jgi:hypothetical protein